MKRKELTEFDDSYFLGIWLENNKDFRLLLEEKALKLQRAYRRRMIQKIAKKVVTDERSAKALRIAAAQRADREARAAEARRLAAEKGQAAATRVYVEATEDEPLVIEFAQSGKIGLTFPQGVVPLVIKKITPDSLADEMAELREGLTLTQIQGESSKQLSYKEALAKIKGIRRTADPLVLTFVDRQGADDQDRDVYATVKKSRFESDSSDSSDSDDDGSYKTGQSRRR